MATNKYSIINNEMFIYELEPYVIDNVKSGVEVIYVQEEKFDEYKQLNPTLPLAKKNYLLMGIHQPVWYEDYQRVMELPDIASPELSFSASEASVNVYEVPCVIELAAVTNPHNVDVVYSVDGVEVLDPSACEISTDGSHTVTASFAGNDYYYSMEVSYALTINIVEDTMDISFANNSVAVSSYLDETWTGQLQPVTGAPQGATIVYSCEDGVIANGELTLPSAGTYTVTVTVSAVHYTTATASYTIVYTQDYRTMNISFAVDSVGVTGNQKEAYTGTVQSVTGAPQGATIVYSCSDANVTISGTSIEIADEGTYTITATVSADYYTTATASYSIVYSQNDLVMNLSFANSAISETLTEGDGYEAQVQAVTGAPQDSTIVYSTSAGSISNGVLTLSSVSDGDSVTVSATVSCPDYVTTTISYTISFTVLSIMDAYFANNSVSVSSYVDETYTGALQAVTSAPSGATITYSCENGTIANGQITFSSVGTYTVYAEISCSGYVTKTISYSIAYTKAQRPMPSNMYFDTSDENVDKYIGVNKRVWLRQASGNIPQSVYGRYSCDNPNGTISAPQITLTAAGTYTITVVFYCTSGIYQDTTYTYDIVVTEVPQTMSLSFSDSSMAVSSYADETYSGTVQSVTGAPSGATIVYSCSDSDVTISGTSIDIAAAGTYTITATVSATGYTTATASYTIVYTQNNRTMSLSFSDSSIAVSSYADETYSGTVQSVTGAPSGATIVYSCSDSDVTISGTSIDIAAAGTYTITATVSATGYTTATASYTIVYTQNNRTMSLSFSNSAISETISGDSYSAQVQAVTGAPQGATVVYSTSDGSISNGTLTVSSISDGDVVTVTATVSATGYTTATASYTITFTVQSQQMDISFEEDTVICKSTTMVWQGEPQAVTDAPNGATVVYSSEDSDIVVQENQGQPWYYSSNEGTYTITATVSADGYETTSISYDLVCEYNEQYRLTAYDSENSMTSSYVSDFDGNGNDLDELVLQEEMDSEYETWYKDFAIASRLDINEPQAANDYNDNMEVAQRDGYDAGSGDNITISQDPTWSNSRTTVYTSANVGNLGNIIFYDQNEGSYVALEDLLSSYAVVDSSLTYVDTNVTDSNLTPHFGLVIENDYNKAGYNLVRFQIDKMDNMDNSIVEEANAIEMFVLVYVAKSVSFAAQKSNLNVSFAQNEYNYSPLGVESVESIIGIPNDYDGTITWDYSTDEVNWTPVQNDLIGDTMDAVVYVRATLPDTSLYNGTQIQYTVTRWTDWSAIAWEGTGITSTTFYFDSEDNPSFPVSVTPIDAPTTNGVSVDSITSSDTSILEIDSNTGEWILKQEGTVTMTATVNDVIQSEYRMCGDSKDLTVTIDIVSGRVETQFMQSSASDVNMIEYVESDLTQSQLPYTITISDVYLQTTQGTAVTLSDSSLIVHDCGPDFSFDNDNNEVTYTAWQLSDMVQATLTFKGDATYKPCSATVYIELNEAILPQGMEVTIFLDDEDSPGMPMSYKEVSYDSDMQGYPYTPFDEYMILKDENGDEIDFGNSEEMSLYEYVSTYVGDENGENETKYDPNDDYMTLSAGTYTIRKTIDQVNDSYAWTGFDIASVEDGIYELVVTIHQIEE